MDATQISLLLLFFMCEVSEIQPCLILCLCLVKALTHHFFLMTILFFIFDAFYPSSQRKIQNSAYISSKPSHGSGTHTHTTPLGSFMFVVQEGFDLMSNIHAINKPLSHYMYIWLCGPIEMCFEKFPCWKINQLV